MYQSQSQPEAFGFAYVEQFRCLADKCESHCCREWSIRVDESKVMTYRNEYPALYNLIAKDSNGYEMRHQKNDICSANEDGLCVVHRDHDESLLSDGCIDFPRVYRSFDTFYTRAASMSCPEVARKCLFDEKPFDIIPTQLPENHKEGKGVTASSPRDIANEKWQKIMPIFINKVLDEQTPVETTLQQLLALAPKLDERDVADWPELLENMSDIEIEKSADDVVLSDNQMGENTTLMLMVLLEHLTGSSIPEHMRQNVQQAFSVLTNHPEPLRCQLLPSYKVYYQEYSSAWLQHALKRLVAAEMSRTGFPFISTSIMGKSYGSSLKEWTMTLAIRMLTLRLFLVISAANVADDNQIAPKDEVLVEWIYQYCRQINHKAIGHHEKVLQELAWKENKLAQLWDF